MTILFQSIFGFFISFIILYYNPRNKFLALFFILNYLQGFVHYFLFHFGNNYIASLLLINSFPIFYLVGPSFYLYIRGLQTGDYRLKKTDWLHLIPFVGAIIFALPYAFLPQEVKFLIVKDLTEMNVGIFDKYHVSAPAIKWYFLSKHLFSFSYILIFGWDTIRKMIRNEIAISKRSKKWFYVFIILANLIHLGPLLYILFSQEEHLIKAGSFGLILFGFLGSMMNISIFFFPEILYGSFLNKIKKEFNHPSKNEQIYSNEEIKVFEELLKQYLIKKNYIDIHFTKSKVMVDLDISDKFFTYYFNDHLGINFQQWKSDLRIDESVRLIKNGYLHGKTLESLAYEVGFLSRNNFTEAFKKRIGHTPSVFVKSLEN